MSRTGRHMSRVEREVVRQRREWRRRHFRLQEGRCFYCSVLMRDGHLVHADLPFRATLDHLVPISRGGADTWENTAAACYTCNRRKSSMTVDEFRRVIARGAP